MRALGVKPGVPDLLMPIAAGCCVGLAIEFKAPNGTGTTSPAQDVWLAKLIENGWAAHVCRTAEGARAIVQAYLGDIELPPL